MAKQLKKSNIINRTGGVSTDDGRTLYGFDAEQYLKVTLPLFPTSLYLLSR